MNTKSNFTVATATLLLVSTFLVSATAFADETQSGRNIAVIIAVSHYDDERFSLPLVANDAIELASTLRQRGGFEIVPLFETRERGAVPNPRTMPTKANIMENVQRVLGEAGPGDTIFLYFSGHGFPHPNDPNITYLLPKDFDPKSLPDSLLETAWLRDQLSRCRATTKIFVIDACHAGGEKSADLLDLDSDVQRTKSLSAHELIDGEMEGVITLASSTKNQLSYFWEVKEMSLFTYWLNEGLKGHADLNGDGVITFNELDEFVNRNVTKTAREVHNVAQTPVRIIRSDVSGVPVVITPRAVSLDVLLDDLAEQIVAAMRIHNVKRTGVLEFTTEFGGRSLDRANSGNLGAYCAEKLEELIRYRLPRRDGFRLVTREAVEKALQTKGIGPDSLFDSRVSTADIRFNDQPMESYVVGTIEGLQGGEVRLRASLVLLDEMERLNTARGTATLTESEWGMLGRSVAVPAAIPVEIAEAEPVIVVTGNVPVTNPADFLPPPQNPRPGYRPPVVESVQPVNTQFVSWIDMTASQMPHPLLSPHRLLDAGIEVRNNSGVFVNRPLQLLDNKMFVPFRVGEVYRIRMRNAHNEWIAARVLVDGLNTLPQRREEPLTKFRVIGQFGDPANVDDEDDEPEEPVSAMAPRVNLNAARYWLLPPGVSSTIPGFFETVGSGAIGREFRIAEAPRSLAAQQDFTEQIGIITIAFYSTRLSDPATRGLRRVGSLGTEAGDAFRTNLRYRDDLELDELLGIIQIHYADGDFTGEAMPGTRLAAPQQQQPQQQQRTPVWQPVRRR